MKRPDDAKLTETRNDLVRIIYLWNQKKPHLLLFDPETGTVVAQEKHDDKFPIYIAKIWQGASTTWILPATEGAKKRSMNDPGLLQDTILNLIIYAYALAEKKEAGD